LHAGLQHSGNAFQDRPNGAGFLLGHKNATILAVWQA
jgi:hypothetical protein